MADTVHPNPNNNTTADKDWGELLFEAEFASNPEPRCPCVLLLDTSKSMAGERIDALNQGLQAFRDELSKDSLSRQRVEVAIVTFGGQVTTQKFVTIEHFVPPILQADGQTPLGTAIHQALDLLESRKAQYRSSGIFYYRPWVFLLTDGTPQGEPIEVTREAVKRIRAAEQDKKLAFFAVGVEGANMKFLSKVSLRTPLKLHGLRIVDLFIWLSKSTERIAHSREGEQVTLPPVDWGTA